MFSQVQVFHFHLAITAHHDMIKGQSIFQIGVGDAREI